MSIFVLLRVSWFLVSKPSHMLIFALSMVRGQFFVYFVVRYRSDAEHSSQDLAFVAVYVGGVIFHISELLRNI